MPYCQGIHGNWQSLEKNILVEPKHALDVISNKRLEMNKHCFFVDQRRLLNSWLTYLCLLQYIDC